MNHTVPGRLERLIWWGTLVIIIGLPFHVLAYSLLHQHIPALASPFRDWKEALTLLLDALAAVMVAGRKGREVLRRPDLWLIAALAALNAGFMAATPDTAAAILAVKVNLVFLLLYAAASVGNGLTPGRRAILTWALLIPAAVAGVFGLLQLLVLPGDVLVHAGFGYGPDQIRPFETIAGSTILRVQSFMFGPNQYGSYLALPLILAAWMAMTRRAIWQRAAGGVLALLLLVNLYGTQSRGSWLGVLAGILTLLWMLVRGRGRWVLAGLAAAAAVALSLSLPHLSHSYLAYQLRHNAPGAVNSSDSSDVLHFQRLQAGLAKLADHPLGEGLTAAGRASDLTGQSFYTENFYLQVADQVGIEGLLLFVVILILAGWRVLKCGDPLAAPLIASLVGLSVMNLFAHTWSDGATALLWWGAAGLAAAGEHRE